MTESQKIWMYKLIFLLKDRYESNDIVEHLEEEMAELLLAIKRFKRNREPLENVIEELCDVTIDCLTVLDMIAGEEEIIAMFERKLKKFQDGVLSPTNKKYTVEFPKL